MFKYFTKGAELQIFYPHDEFKTAAKRANYMEHRSSIHESDEINGYKIARFLGTSDCIWSIFSFELFFLSQAVVPLPIHLRDDQDIFIRDNRVIGMPDRTMLTAFFELNALSGNDVLHLDPTHRISDLLYEELPQFFVWITQSKMWSQRTKKSPVAIGRLNNAIDSQAEMWSLRLLLQNVKGPKSFDDLLHGATTFVEAAGAAGLLADEAEYEHYMREVAHEEHPVRCRQVFADLLMSVAVPNPIKLWNEMKDLMSQDFRYQSNHLGSAFHETCNKHALWSVNECLKKLGSSLDKFGFAQFSYCRSSELSGALEQPISRITCTAPCTFQIEEKLALNAGQLLFFDEIERMHNSKMPYLLILQAPGGTGKTHTMNMIIKFLLDVAVKVAVTSTTGISATALIGGRTVHSALNAGIIVPEANTGFNITPQSKLAAEWRAIEVLIIDEVMCLHRHFLEAISFTLKNNVFIDYPDRLAMGTFCGISVILTGDPRQQLPITQSANRGTIVASSLHCSDLFQLFQHTSLTENVRIHPSVNIIHDDDRNQSLQEWILNVGNGKMQPNDEIVDDAHYVRIPKQFYIGDSQNDLIDRIYGSITGAADSYGEDFFGNRIILASLYQDVRLINLIMIKRIQDLGIPVYSVKSHDTVTGIHGNVDMANMYSASRFPEHEMKLFIGCPVMCLRALNQQVNNGDRGVVRSISMYRLGLFMLTGASKGSIVHLPRMRFTPASSTMKIEMTRLQFGVAIAFAITVSKSQSCGFQHVGIWLNDHLFAHGQLYLALSRIRVGIDGLYTLLFASHNDIMRDCRGVFARNIVYDEVLQAYHISNK
jgi:ATP-dependent DNA helicase PIF1